jgi:uncharacterized membrane protein YgcG
MLALSLVGILLIVATTAATDSGYNNSMINRFFQTSEAQLTDNNNNNANVSLVSQRAYNDANLFHIIGEAQNTGIESAEFVQIVASFYNANGQFVGTSYTFTSPTTVSPGTKAPFDIQMLTEDKIVKESKSYKLTLSWIDQNGKEIVKQYESAQIGQGQGQGQEPSSPTDSGNNILSQIPEATTTTDISFGAKALQFLTYCNSQFSQTLMSSMTIDTLVFCTMVYDWYYIGCNNAIITPIIAAQCKDPVVIQQVNNYKTQIDIRIKQIIVPPPPEPCDSKNQTCPPRPPTCSPPQYYDSSEKKCVTPPPPGFGCIATTYMRYDPIKKQWECIPLDLTLPGTNTTILNPGNNETSPTGQEQQKQTISPEDIVHCPASLDYRYNSITNSCEYLGPPEDPCKKDPAAVGCEPILDPCIKNPNAEECESTPPPPPPPPPDEGDTDDKGDTDTGDGGGDSSDSSDSNSGGSGGSSGGNGDSKVGDAVPE